MSRNLLLGVLVGVCLGIFFGEYLMARTIHRLDYSPYRVVGLQPEIPALKLRNGKHTVEMRGFNELRRNGITEYEYNKTAFNDEYMCHPLWDETPVFGIIFDKRLRCHLRKFPSRLKPRTLRGASFICPVQLEWRSLTDLV